MQEKILKNLSRLFIGTFGISFLIYASGGCHLNTSNQKGEFIKETITVSAGLLDDSDTDSECSSSGDTGTEIKKDLPDSTTTK